MTLPLAYGLGGITDYGTEAPWIDWMRFSRPWQSNNGMDYSALKANGYIGANDYPTQIPPGGTNVSTVWAHTGAAAAAYAGDWVLTWEGTGTVVVIGDGVFVSSSSGRIEYTRPGLGSTSLAVVFDAIDVGDPPHDMHMFRAEHEALFDAGQEFTPDFLALYGDAVLLRFMNWQKTNDSVQQEWADRPTDNLVTFSGQGASVECMVRLCNLLQVDGWFNLPHKATDEYIEEFSTYVRDNLDPGLTAYYEYSNEDWNSGFQQFTYANLYVLPTVDESPNPDQWFTEYGGAGDVYKMSGYLATHAMKIVTDVYTGELERVMRVMGTQTGYLAVLDYKLDTESWWTENYTAMSSNDALTSPDGTRTLEPYFDPLTVFDAVAPTCYFGGESVSDPTRRAALIAQIDANPGNVDVVYDWLTNLLLTDDTLPRSVPYYVDLYASVRAQIDGYGLITVPYEGGSHEHHSAFVDISPTDLEKLTTFYAGYSYSPQFATVYDAAYDAAAASFDTFYMQFVGIDTPSQFGSFGSIRYYGDTNERHGALTARTLGLPYRRFYAGVKTKA